MDELLDGATMEPENSVVDMVVVEDANTPLSGSNKDSSILPSAICSFVFVVGMCLVFWSVAYNINRKRKAD